MAWHTKLVVMFVKDLAMFTILRIRVHIVMAQEYELFEILWMWQPIQESEQEQN